MSRFCIDNSLFLLFKNFSKKMRIIPPIKRVITGINGLTSKYFLMNLYSSNPVNAEGKNPIIKSGHNFRLFHNDFPYMTKTADMAPNWITISKVVKKFDWGIFNKKAVKIKCPVEDTGRNSVIPSTIDRIRTSAGFIIALTFTDLVY